MQEGSSEATYVLVLVEDVEGLDGRHGGGDAAQPLCCQYCAGPAVIGDVLVLE